MTKDDLYEELKKIEFFKDGKHPEYIPFIGEDYLKYRILHIGESHYIPNYPEWKNGEKDSEGNVVLPNRITLRDFDGWWTGDYSDDLHKLIGWFNTSQVVIDYMKGYRDKAHGIFNNTLKSFCKIVTPEESFDSITTENSKKYNYFAFMNFYQQPSIYYGESFTDALYTAGEYLNWDTERIDKRWYEVFDESVRIVEGVIEVLNPKAIVVTSNEIYRYYRDYGSIDEDNRRQAGKLFHDDRIIWVDHPGSAWWFRIKQGEGKNSKERFEDALRRIYL